MDSKNKNKDFEYIDNHHALQKAAEEWKQCKELGIDIECENNLHHYGSYISLIQISSKDQSWIIDVLKLKNIPQVIEMIGNHQQQKIFHDVSFDLRILCDTYKCHPKNIFDTQLAAIFLGKENLGLGSLLEGYLNVKKEQKFQMADWTKRPLSEEMLDYAVNDTKYLIHLRDTLKEELKSMNRLSWVEEECSLLETKEWNQKKQSFIDVRGVKTLSQNEMSIFRQLFILRDKLARKVDRPVHFIMHNKTLFEISKNPPRSVNDIRKIKNIHPIVKRQAELFLEAFKKVKSPKVIIDHEKPKKFSDEQKRKFEELENLRDQISQKISIAKHLLMSKDQMIDIVLNNSYRSLRQWQKNLVK